MKCEFEVRLLDVNLLGFINKMEENKAEFIGSWLQRRYIYDFNPADENKWIRLRTNGIKNTLTIKEINHSGIDGVFELETEVGDFETTDMILSKLGYFKRSIQENQRIRYMLDGVEIDIDTWPGLNTFVEFEGKNEKSIKMVLKKLQIDYNLVTTENVFDIYLKNGYSKEDMNNLKFKESENDEI